MSATPARVIGVVGAGTMGAGIAQLAAQSGAQTLVHDADADALGRGLTGVRAALDRGVRRGRWDAEAATAATGRLQAVEELDGLTACELVVEAAPERLELKRDLLRDLEAVVAPDCVLATNTSSLPVAALAGASARPGRVVGMHFFNPAPVMRLVEVVAHQDADPGALARVRATGEAMGKTVIDAADGPGFLVNRCNRPFGLEALRLVAERRATVEQVDRICRLGGGFRMGPFELADLVGLDVGLEVSRSFWEQSFGEPRWRPSPLLAQTVAAGRLGRKSGRGWYRHAGAVPTEDPEPPRPGGGQGRLVVVAGDGPLAAALALESDRAGWTVGDPASAEGEVPWLIVDCSTIEDGPVAQGAPRAMLCGEGSLAARDGGGSAAGFYALAGAPLAEMCRSADSATVAVERTLGWLRSLGRVVEEVGDAPGLVLGRIVCQLANEAAFALGEGVGSARDIDLGLRLGLNHPIGALERADALGLDHVVAVLDALREDLGDAYRAAPELRRRVLRESVP